MLNFISFIISKTMGQLQNATSSTRVAYDENGNNGFVLCDKYIPEELLAELLCYVDYKSLLNCQIVCKRWKVLIQEYVWRKKAEMIFGQSLQCIKDMPWPVYYVICKKNPFDKNLVKNHSGQNGLKKDWQIVSQGGDHWKVENPPNGVPPLPDDPVFEGHQSCFVTSYFTCTKRQIINLVEEGLSPYLLDTFQPPIVVSEWYSCRWDCPASYECFIALLDENNKTLKSHKFRDILEGDEKQNKWHHFTYEFTNYGTGVKQILFQDGGCDCLFWAGHYGSKMAGASVVVKVKPNKLSSTTVSERKHTDNKEPLAVIDHTNNL
ncbi:F-box only protein 6-like [Chelonus insularis]|uniref:F-box only protein 6-like n=1 Tax=Chelonus insularis TaxID=460826 RepID=UPI00158A31BF|nr:F-box only protein 6-like [Chelonus insularis]